MFALRSLVLIVGVCWLALTAASSSGVDKKDKKKDGKDYSGVITQVHRDSDPKDNDIGFIVLRTKNDTVKVTVMKNTDIVNNGKGVGFKALDKGDVVTVHARPGHPSVADKIVIRKN